MKKYLSMILALVMVFALCACNNDDSPTVDTGDTGNQSGGAQQSASDLSQFKGKLLEPTIQLIASGSYMYEVTGPGETVPITYAKVGSNTLITCVMDGTPTSFVTMNGKNYIAFSAKKIYAELTEADMAQYNLDNFESSVAALDFSDLKSCTYTAAGEATVGETVYKYEDYYNPLKQTSNRFLFTADNKLAYMTVVDASGQQGELIAITLYSANSGVFDVLQTYTLVDLANQAAYTPSTEAAQ